MKKFLIPLLLLLSFFGFSQEESEVHFKKENPAFFKDEFIYQIRAYFGIGGSMPLGLPSEIEKIKSYNPGLQLGLEANATKYLGEESPWGLRIGIAVEERGMKTEAEVKQYVTRIIQANEEIKGYFTGNVETKVNNTYLKIPLSLVYKLSENWNVYGGLNFSFAIDKDFTGYVSDGYLRKDTPVGPQINFDKEGKAAYDFSKEVQTFQWGIHIGGEYRLKNRRFIIFPQLNYNFNGVLNKDFDAIGFSLHNLYLDLGFGYRF